MNHRIGGSIEKLASIQGLMLGFFWAFTVGFLTGSASQPRYRAGGKERCRKSETLVSRKKMRGLADIA